MTRYQSDVLWLGLILVALNIVINISSIKSVIFSGPKASSGGSNSSGGGGGGINLPNLPLPPIPGLPVIPIPGLPGLPNPVNLSQQQPTPPGTLV